MKHVRRRIRVLIISHLLAVSICLLLGEHMAIARFDQPTTPGKSARYPDSTAWTDPVGNLAVRVLYTPEVEFTEPIEIGLQLRTDNGQQSGTAGADSLMLDGAEVVLQVVNMQTFLGERYRQSISAIHLLSAGGIGADAMRDNSEVWSEPLAFEVDQGWAVIDLSKYNRNTGYIWNEPRTKTLRESLPSGTYAARLDLVRARSETGGWHGLITSPSFTIRVSPTKPEQEFKIFLFPHEFRFTEGPIVDWAPDAVDTVAVETNPYGWLDYRIKSSFGDIRSVGLPECPIILLRRDLPRALAQSKLSLKPGDRRNRIVFVDGRLELHFSFELIELSIAPQRDCYIACSDRAEMLWSMTLDTVMTKAQFDSLTLQEQDVYEYHTIIVPTALRFGHDDNLLFDNYDAELREVRFPKGWLMETELKVGYQESVRIDRPPSSPMVLAEHPLPNGTIPLVIKVYAVRPGQSVANGRDSLDYLLLWSGSSTINNKDREFEVIEELSQPAPEIWSFRSCYLPGRLLMTDSLYLISDYTDSIEVSINRRPETALLAAVISGSERFTNLPPYLAGAAIKVKYPSLEGDTMTCSIDLYERPEGSGIMGSYDRLWSRTYRIPLTAEQAETFRELLRTKPEYHFP